MQIGKWNPNRGKAVLSGVPLYQPSQESVNRFFMLFYTMVGGYSSIVQTMITDLYNYVKLERKDLYRFKAKKSLCELKKCSDKLIEGFKYYMQEQGLYQLWLDTTDVLEEELRDDVKKQYYMLDNEFLKHNINEHKLYSLIVIAEISSGMFRDAIGRFAELMSEYNGVHTFNLAERFKLPIKGICTKAREVMETMYPMSVDNLVFAGKQDKFKLGFEVIGMKMFDFERADKALEKAVKLNGLNLTLDGSDTENPIDNAGTPWNDAQVRALCMGYPVHPDKEIAQIVGRSVYAVRKKAKELGLSKSKEYLKEIRVNNLKKKQQ